MNSVGQATRSFDGLSSLYQGAFQQSAFYAGHEWNKRGCHPVDKSWSKAPSSCVGAFHRSLRQPLQSETASSGCGSKLVLVSPSILRHPQTNCEVAPSIIRCPVSEMCASLGLSSEVDVFSLVLCFCILFLVCYCCRISMDTCW